MRTVYDEIGGEDVVRRIVEAFYDTLETDPAGKIVHDLHLDGFGMNHVRTAQFEFLCGFLGGPKYYVERMGHANIKRMHEHLKIGAEEARGWLICMERAIDAVGVAAPQRARLMQTFRRVAEILVNKPGEPSAAGRLTMEARFQD